MKTIGSKWMRLIFLGSLSGCLLALPLPKANPEEVGVSETGLAEIAPEVERLIQEKKLTGASVLVLKNGKVIYQKQFGHRDVVADLPMESNTLCRIYSMTKALTSVAALMLYEEGKLDLDEPIQRYLPELKTFKVWPEQKAQQQPTVRDLLRHTAGFTNSWGKGKVEQRYREAKVLDRSVRLDQLPKSLATVPLAYEPGTAWRYNISTDVLAAVVAAVEKKPFEQVLAERLIQPLAMTDTAYRVPEEKQPRFSVTYEVRKGTIKPKDGMATSAFLKDRPFKGGGSGLVSTITDYARFLLMIAGDGEFEGRRYLKKETIDLMRTNQLPEGIPCISFGKDLRHGTGFGLGFAVRVAEDNRWDKDARVGEYGWGGLASTHYWLSPKDDLIVITMEQTLPYSSILEMVLKPIIYQAIK